MFAHKFRHSRGSRFPGSTLSLGILIILVLTACGDQNTPVASQSGTAIGVQVPSGPVSGVKATTAPSKPTSKPDATTAAVAKEVLHVCSLLSKDEVAASLGGPVDIMDAASDAIAVQGQGSCNYTSSSAGLTVQVSFLDIAKADFERGFNINNAQAVPDLGDTSFFLGGQLSTLKGKVGVVILLVTPAIGGSNTLSNAIGLTNKILTAIEKTSYAGNLTSTAASNTKPVTAADLPVYPGAVLVSNTSVSGIQTATFTSTDGYDAIVSWYKKVVADKIWTGSATSEPEADYSIISAGKATATTTSQLLVSIEGPKKADRNLGSDANGNPIVLSPNSTLIIVALT